MESPSLAEELVSALIVHLLRSGAIEEADLLSAEMSAEARHLAKALVIEASAPPTPRLRAVRGQP